MEVLMDVLPKLLPQEKTDVNLTQEKEISSVLSNKIRWPVGVNGTTQDYVISSDDM
jgi:hypothetical protein